MLCDQPQSTRLTHYWIHRSASCGSVNRHHNIRDASGGYPSSSANANFRLVGSHHLNEHGYGDSPVKNPKSSSYGTSTRYSVEGAPRIDCSRIRSPIGDDAILPPEASFLSINQAGKNFFRYASASIETNFQNIVNGGSLIFLIS